VVPIDSGQHHHVCAARYIIHCTKEVWKVRVESEPGPRSIGYVVYGRLKRTPGVREALQRGEKRTPFDLCGLEYDEEVEFELHATNIPIPLKTIDSRLFELGRTVNVSRDELARQSQRLLSAEERKRLPALVTFTIIDH
jgi:hypothetical protein